MVISKKVVKVDLNNTRIRGFDLVNRYQSIFREIDNKSEDLLNPDEKYLIRMQEEFSKLMKESQKELMEQGIDGLQANRSFWQRTFRPTTWKDCYYWLDGHPITVYYNNEPGDYIYKKILDENSEPTCLADVVATLGTKWRPIHLTLSVPHCYSARRKYYLKLVSIVKKYPFLMGGIRISVHQYAKIIKYKGYDAYRRNVEAMITDLGPLDPEILLYELLDKNCEFLEKVINPIRDMFKGILLLTNSAISNYSGALKTEGVSTWVSNDVMACM